jgi:hypothetical protein
MRPQQLCVLAQRIAEQSPGKRTELEISLSGNLQFLLSETQND